MMRSSSRCIIGSQAFSLDLEFHNIKNSMNILLFFFSEEISINRFLWIQMTILLVKLSKTGTIGNNSGFLIFLQLQIWF